jgi:tetratricopeptide (TPR) repeat protein
LGFHQTQRYQEALPFLASAADAAVDWAEAQRALGECAFIVGDFEQAALSYERAYQLDRTVGSVRDLTYFADSMARRGDIETALAGLELALQRFPYAPGLHAKFATLYQQDGNLLDAYYHFTLEILVQGKRGEFSAPARVATNEIYAQVEADENSPYRHELVLVSQGMNDMQPDRAHAALHSLEHVLRITRSTTIVPHLLLADAQLHLQQLDAARKTLDQALALYPSFVPAMVMMARTLRGLGEDEAAQAMLEEAFRLFPAYWKIQAENVRQRG